MFKKLIIGIALISVNNCTNIIAPTETKTEQKTIVGHWNSNTSIINLSDHGTYENTFSDTLETGYYTNNDSILILLNPIYSDTSFYFERDTIKYTLSDNKENCLINNQVFTRN